MLSAPSAMIVDARKRAMQLRLDLAECPAPGAVLWELVGEPAGDEPVSVMSCDQTGR